MPITTHETPGPLDLDIRVQAGRVDIETADTAETTVEIEALSGGDPRPGPAAVESACQELRSVGDGYRLVIEIPKRPRLFGWNEPEVLVRVLCPHGSAVVAKTASADLELRGRAGDFSTKTASGDVTVEAADGNIDIKTASGDVAIGAVAGRAGVNTMSGDIVIDEASASVSAHTMSGDLRIERLATGTAEMRTMSGDIVASVRAGATSGSMPAQYRARCPPTCPCRTRLLRAADRHRAPRELDERRHRPAPRREARATGA